MNTAAPASNAVVALNPRLAQPPAAQAVIPPAEWQVLVDVIWPTARDPNVILTAWNYCRVRHLDPFKRPVHIVPIWSTTLNKYVESLWPGIGELQITAARTGQWAGMDAPEYGPMIRRKFSGTTGPDNRPETRTIELEFPEYCSVTVWRIVHNMRVSFCEPVYWLETYARIGRSELPADMWARRPHNQLAKCAKAASLRAAFPEEMGNEYTSDEMEGQAVDTGGPIIDAEPEPRERPRPAAKSRPPSAAAARATASGNGGVPAEPPANDGYVPPDYQILLPGGETLTFHTGTEFIRRWDEGLKALAGRSKIIAAVVDANKKYLDAVGEFDPQARDAVLDAIDIARGPET